MNNPLQPLIEMHTWIWDQFKTTLAALSPGEVDWRPLPQANNINVIVRHLRIEAEWHADCLEHAMPMPIEVTPEVRKQIDSTPLDFATNFKSLEESYTAFLEALRSMDAVRLKQHSLAAYREWPGDAPAHMLGFHQVVHLAMHMAQISTIRNLYRTTKGEPALFFPDNPTYPSEKDQGQSR